MFQGFYILTEDCVGEKTHPNGWEGNLTKGTPVALTYFDEDGMEFTDGERLKSGEQKEFRLPKPCAIIEGASCQRCGKIVPTIDIEKHMMTDKNCLRIEQIYGEKQ